MLSIHISQRLEDKEEKEEFSKLDEMVESIPRIDRLVNRLGWNGNVCERKTCDEDGLGRGGVKERNAGQMVVDFGKRMKIAVVNTKLKNRREYRVRYKSGGMTDHWQLHLQHPVAKYGRQ